MKRHVKKPRQQVASSPGSERDGTREGGGVVLFEGVLCLETGENLQKREWDITETVSTFLNVLYTGLFRGDDLVDC